MEDTRPVPNAPQVPPERPWSLRARVTLVLGVAVVLPILGSAVYFTGRKQADQQGTVRAHIRGVATRLCSAADVHLDKHRSAIAALAASLTGDTLAPTPPLHEHPVGLHMRK